jgi:hypothetical protein
MGARMVALTKRLLQVLAHWAPLGDRSPVEPVLQPDLGTSVTELVDFMH